MKDFFNFWWPSQNILTLSTSDKLYLITFPYLIFFLSSAQLLALCLHMFYRCKNNKKVDYLFQTNDRQLTNPFQNSKLSMKFFYGTIKTIKSAGFKSINFASIQQHIKMIVCCIGIFILILSKY